MTREIFYSCFNVPEIGVSVDIYSDDGDTLHAAFSKPYAFDSRWAALEDLVASACGQEASWDSLNVLSCVIGTEPVEAQARKFWITVVTAEKHFSGLKDSTLRVESSKETK